MSRANIRVFSSDEKGPLRADPVGGGRGASVNAVARKNRDYGTSTSAAPRLLGGRRRRRSEQAPPTRRRPRKTKAVGTLVGGEVPPSPPARPPTTLFAGAMGRPRSGARRCARMPAENEFVSAPRAYGGRSRGGGVRGRGARVTRSYSHAIVVGRIARHARYATYFDCFSSFFFFVHFVPPGERRPDKCIKTHFPRSNGRRDSPDDDDVQIP